MNALPNLELFAQATLSIILEAVPFLLMGALASGIVEAFVPREKVERLLPKGRLAATWVARRRERIFSGLRPDTTVVVSPWQ